MQALKMPPLSPMRIGQLIHGVSNRVNLGVQLDKSKFSDDEAAAFEQFSASQEFDGIRHLLPMIWLAEKRETPSVAIHLQRIRGGVHWLAMAAGESEESAYEIALAAIFHDIGMAWIEPLSNPARWFVSDNLIKEKLKGHCAQGSEFLAGLSLFPMQLAATIARDHHECWDGNGFPNARRGPELSLAGRILALVHFYEENTHVHHNGPHTQHEEWSVIEMIDIASGHYFDPRLCDCILRNPDEFCSAMAFYGTKPSIKSNTLGDWNLICNEDYLIDLDLLLKKIPLL